MLSASKRLFRHLTDRRFRKAAGHTALERYYEQQCIAGRQQFARHDDWLHATRLRDGCTSRAKHCPSKSGRYPLRSGVSGLQGCTRRYRTAGAAAATGAPQDAHRNRQSGFLLSSPTSAALHAATGVELSRIFWLDHDRVFVTGCNCLSRALKRATIAFPFALQMRLHAVYSRLS